MIKSYLSIILATVYSPHSFITSLKFIFSSHSELYTILILVGFKILATYLKYVSPFFLVSSKDKEGLVFDLLDGLPIIAVKSSMTKTISCPNSCNIFNAIKGTVWPKCKSGLDGSAPNLTTNFFHHLTFLIMIPYCKLLLFVLKLNQFFLFYSYNIALLNKIKTATKSPNKDD